MTARNPVQPVEILEEVAAAAQESIEGIVKAGQEQVQKSYDETVAVTKEQLDLAQEQLTRAYEDFQSFQQGNVDAVIASSTLAAKGAERISKALMAYVQGSFDKSVALGKAVLAAKSVEDVIAASNDYAKSSYETALAEATKLRELTLQVANEAAAPLSARFNVAVETLSKPMAA